MLGLGLWKKNLRGSAASQSQKGQGRPTNHRCGSLGDLPTYARGEATRNMKSPGQESNLRYRWLADVVLTQVEAAGPRETRSQHDRKRRCCSSSCEQISWSKAESQQIAVRWLLYWLRHPDRELSRLQMIWHLHAAWGEYLWGPRQRWSAERQRPYTVARPDPRGVISLPPDARSAKGIVAYPGGILT